MCLPLSQCFQEDLSQLVFARQLSIIATETLQARFLSKVYVLCSAVSRLTGEAERHY